MKPRWGEYLGALDMTEQGLCPACGMIPFDMDGPCCGAMWNEDCELTPEASIESAQGGLQDE